MFNARFYLYVNFYPDIFLFKSELDAVR